MTRAALIIGVALLFWGGVAFGRDQTLKERDKYLYPTRAPAPVVWITPKPAAAAPAATAESAQLGYKADDWNWTVNEFGIIHVNGEVTNLSTKPLAGVRPMVVFLNQSGAIVKSATGYLAYDPLAPGESSPYQLSATNDPSIDTAKLSFGTIDGTKLTARVLH